MAPFENGIFALKKYLSRDNHGVSRDFNFFREIKRVGDLYVPHLATHSARQLHLIHLRQPWDYFCFPVRVQQSLRLKRHALSHKQVARRFKIFLKSLTCGRLVFFGCLLLCNRKILACWELNDTTDNKRHDDEKSK